MNKIVLSLLYLALMVVLNQCDDGKSEYTDDINFHMVYANKSYHVHCDSVCASCLGEVLDKSGQPTNEIVYFTNKSYYKPIYDRCNDFFDTGTVIIDTVTIGLLEFEPAVGDSNKYGFDGWRNLPGNITTLNANYLSLKSGDTTYIIANIRFRDKDYDRFVARIGSPDLGRVSFLIDSNVVSDSAKLHSGKNTLKIFSSTSGKGETQIDVFGISGSIETLIGGKTGTDREDDLKVEVYNGTKSNCNIYRILKSGGSTPDPDTSTMRTEFDSILNQAVVCVDTITKNNFSRTEWDNNNNGILDHFPDTFSVPYNWLEDIRLIEQIESTFIDLPSCYEVVELDQEPKIMILPGKIRRNWLIAEQVDPGDQVISLHGVGNLKRFKIFNIGNEYHEIDYVDQNLGTITLVDTVLGSYSPNETISDSGFPVKGMTIYSCAFYENAINWIGMVHEYLHTNRVGPLSHTIKDSTNVMYPYTGNRRLLRYRALDTEEFIENQWIILDKM